jgi:hypothetical protein
VKNSFFSSPSSVVKTIAKEGLAKIDEVVEFKQNGLILFF